MHKAGPIIVIEDDEEDQEILQEIFNKLNYPNKVLFFSESDKALEYISDPNHNPFLILSDLNMPKTDGLTLRNKIFADKQLQAKCIPYLFFTTGTHQKAVIDAYGTSVQGFFIKPSNLTALENTLRKIIEYWQESFSPNHYN